MVKLDYDSFNKKYVPYLRGNKKTFQAFTSTTPDEKTSIDFLGKNNSGTIFTLSGKVWGYDISLFNICGEEEILLEPERKFIIKESHPGFNGIVYVRCAIEDTPIVLDGLLGFTKNYLKQKQLPYFNPNKTNPNYPNYRIESWKKSQITKVIKIKINF